MEFHANRFMKALYPFIDPQTVQLLQKVNRDLAIHIHQSRDINRHTMPCDHGMRTS